MDIFCKLERSAGISPDKKALIFRNRAITFRELLKSALQVAASLSALGVGKGDRVAIFLDKSIETVVAMLGMIPLGAILVPINPQLKPHQVRHILDDSGARILFTARSRYLGLQAHLENLEATILCDANPDAGAAAGSGVYGLGDFLALEGPVPFSMNTDGDPAVILYTSGSTGLPKGVLLSHRNLVAGAESVNRYLGQSADDVILSLLPLSFDAGLSQLTTALDAGCTLVLVNYLHASEVILACQAHGVTSITGVPPLWSQLMQADWPDDARLTLRRFANTGGHMNATLLGSLRRVFSNASPYLMYGLTEAFRSTYLDPREIDRRPDSIGKAVPNAEILVLRPDGTPCEAGEIGELVHRGAFVTLGYWNDPERTRLRYRRLNTAYGSEIAVWSGDMVRRDDEGFLYFVGRTDEMLKSSGYRISPDEIESVLATFEHVKEAVVIGVPHEDIGHRIVAFVVASCDALSVDELKRHIKKLLPTYMLPGEIYVLESIPRNVNGKFDRKALSADMARAEQHAEQDVAG